MKGVYECEMVAQNEVAPGVVRAQLRGPEIAREARPGQFVNVQVSRTTDPLLRRPFSVHAADPGEGLFSLLYATIGRGTQLLAKAAPGEKLSVVGPLGKPFDLGESPDAEHVVVAGGCGAAPLYFLARELCEKWGSEKVTVLTGARSRDAVLCEAEFRSGGVQIRISTDDGSCGHCGTVTQLLEQHLTARTASEALHSPLRVYSCGPQAMLVEVAQICREAGAASCQVSLENYMACGLGVCMGCVQKIRGPAPGDDSGRDWHYERVCVEGPVFEARDVIWP